MWVLWDSRVEYVPCGSVSTWNSKFPCGLEHKRQNESKRKVKLNYITLYVLTTLSIYLCIDSYIQPFEYNPKNGRNVA